MERTLISWNVPNLVTINLMAWIGFLFFVLLFQMIVRRRAGGSATTPPGSNTSAIVPAAEGY